jgi:hypothetical protein
MKRAPSGLAGFALLWLMVGCGHASKTIAPEIQALGASTVDTITIVDAVWFHPNASVNVKSQLEARCNGKVICEAIVNDLQLPQPNSDPEVKQLRISYLCGSTSQSPVNSREYGIFRLNCSNPTEPQPAVVSVDHINLAQSLVKADGTEYLGLPPGYAECWTYTFDLNSNYASVDENRVSQLDGSVMYEIDWHLRPPLFGGNAWMNRIYMVAGQRSADATARCPPHP